MDELLVTWLTSDNVYENVLNLIETFRQEEANDGNNSISSSNNPNHDNNTFDSPPSSPRRKSSNSLSSDQLQQQQNEQELADSTKSKVTIPPFYRPPGTVLNGLKVKSIRRSRSDSFDSDQSWDGIYSVDSTSSSSSDPTKENTDDSNTNNNTNNNSANINTTKSNIPIKEQVHNIFEELGKPQEIGSKYLNIDNFIKITKDICNFPTFFNKPLYKRILYMWNTQDIKSNRGKIILWNEYYNNADNLEIGVDSDEDDGNKSSDEKGDGDQQQKEKKKKKKSNPLLNQLDRFITQDIFKWYWEQEMEDYDLSERFYRLLKKPHEDYVAKDDFGPFIKELLNDHPVSSFIDCHCHCDHCHCDHCHFYLPQ